MKINLKISNIVLGIEQFFCFHHDKILKDESYSEESSKDNSFLERKKINTYFCSNCGKEIKEVIYLGVIKPTTQI